MARNAHPEETERRILAAARSLFVEKGYEKTSIQDIVNALGDLSKGAIYHHFKSKDAILQRLNADDWAESVRLRDELLERRDLNALEKLRTLVLSSVRSAEHLNLVRSQLPTLDDPASFAASMRFWSSELPTSLLPLLEEGMQDGSIPTAYPAQAAQLIALLCNYWLLPCFYPASRPEMESRVRCLSAMLDAIDVHLFDGDAAEQVVDGLVALASQGSNLAA